jgi:hypothetical protein
LSWTDAGLSAEPGRPAEPVPLLAIDGLRAIAALVARRREAGDLAADASEGDRGSPGRAL